MFGMVEGSWFESAYVERLDSRTVSLFFFVSFSLRFSRTVVFLCKVRLCFAMFKEFPLAFSPAV